MRKATISEQRAKLQLLRVIRLRQLIMLRDTKRMYNNKFVSVSYLKETEERCINVVEWCNYQIEISS